MSDANDHRRRREQLGRWLGGQALPEHASADSEGWGPWVRASQQEGVAGLVHAVASGRGAQRPGSPALAQALSGAARDELIASMAFEAQARRVLGHLANLRTPALLLKGVALAQWAYGQPHWRSCGDIDLLLPSREAAEQLARRLAGDGFERANPSGDLVAYELMCQKVLRDDWTLEVDVHWQLTNSPLFARAFGFDELMAHAVAIPSLGAHARGLGPVHALLHAAMHRAHNLAGGVDDRLKWLYDVVVLTQRFTEADWRQCVAWATQRQLAGVTLSALAAAVDVFGVAMPPAALDTLREAARGEPLDATRLGDWRYMQGQTVRALPGLRPRLRWLWQRLFPSRDYMRYLYGASGEPGSYAGLLRVRAGRAWHRWRGGA